MCLNVPGEGWGEGCASRPIAPHLGLNLRRDLAEEGVEAARLGPLALQLVEARGAVGGARLVVAGAEEEGPRALEEVLRLARGHGRLAAALALAPAFAG